jgi:septal ring factor EnvC (AmiA/AmiB activator)
VSRRSKLRLAAATLACAFGCCAGAATREEDLAALRSRIGTLAAELDAKQASQREARDALRASERAISEANRMLAALELEARSARDEARRHAERGRALEVALATQREALARLVAARAAAGAPDALRVVLSGEDATDIARQLYYLGRVSAAAARLIGEFRGNQAELDTLKQTALARAARLGEIDSAQRRDRERVVAERRSRRQLLDSLAAEIRRSRREIAVLRADEARLARVIEEIGRLLAARPGAGFAPRPGPGQAVGSRFSALRGRLAMPVSGQVLTQFHEVHPGARGRRQALRGRPQREPGPDSDAQSGSTAGFGGEKGIFIQAGEGQPVRAVAAGQVVYADWMRGFGNLLILDHGESYLSVYANAESLLKQVGEAVLAGEQIATVGSSGGAERSGLYFELRHMGRPFDALRWIGRR